MSGLAYFLTGVASLMMVQLALVIWRTTAAEKRRRIFLERYGRRCC